MHLGAVLRYLKAPSYLAPFQMSLSLCQLPGQQFLRQCQAKVTKCTPLSVLELKMPAIEAQGAKYAVELNETCLYPEGGGQPYDLGQIKLGDSITVPIVNTQRPDDSGPILHFVPEPLVPGSDVVIEVDWPRRFDHMQQHSSQHLISATFKEKFGFETTSWSMGKYPEESMIELEAASISASQLAEVNEFINQQILNATSMVVHVFDSVEKAKSDATYQKSLGAGQAKSFPENLVGPARCVEIPNLEMNACGGTHVDNLSKLQAIVIYRTAQAGKAHTRIFFNAGGRLLKEASEMKAREHQITFMLGAPANEHIAQLDRLQQQLKSKIKEVESVGEELAELRASSLVSLKPTNPEDRLDVVTHEETGCDVKSLQRLGNVFIRAATAAGIRRVLIATSVEEGKQSTDAEGVNGVFFLGGPQDMVAAVGASVAKILGGRGGGARGCFQGKGNRFDQLREAVEEAKRIIAEKFPL